MYLYAGLSRPVSAAILLLFCLYLGLSHALFGLLVGLARQSRQGIKWALLAAPFLWVAVELARARITSFPWDQLGVSQVDNHLLALLAPWTGEYGMSFVIAAVNTLFVAAVFFNTKARRLALLGMCALLALALQAGTRLQPSPEPAPHRAVLLQANLPVGPSSVEQQLTLAQMLVTFGQLSTMSSGPTYAGLPDPDKPFASASIGPYPPDLIVWPEAETPFRQDDPTFRSWMSSLAISQHASLIIGAMAVDFDPGVQRGYRLYNSAAFFAEDGSYAGRYDKMHLVPFGEYIPFKDFLFFAKNLTQQAGDMDHGQHRINFTTDDHSFGTFICYESVFADEVRLFVANGAQVLVNISNDGWYGDTSAPWQHMNMARMRAIENHRWLLRSTNTGITASIDPDGRVEFSAPRHVRTAISVGFDYNRRLTFYTQYGDIFAYACSLIAFLVAVLAFMRQQELA